MKNKYILVELNDKNEFRVSASFNILGVDVYTDALKIDTGCGYTTFPAYRFNMFSPEELFVFKLQDLNNKTCRHLSYGVETGGFKNKKPITKQDWIDSKAVSFDKEVGDFYIDAIKIDVDKVRINYDRRGNLLLGMDILSQMDFHCGISKISNRITFIACPNNQLNDEYFKVLYNHFKIGESIP